MIAAMQGAEKTIGIDSNNSRLNFSKNVGASDLIKSFNEKITEKIRDITQGTCQKW